jgi:hypothetical protein
MNPPVIWRARSEARNDVISATSSVSPILFKGIYMGRSLSLSSGIIDVRVAPGQMQFTRIPETDAGVATGE